MLTHIVTIRFAPGATEEQIGALVAGLEGLPGEIAEIGAFSVARDLGLVEGNYDLAVVGRFASADDLHAYIAHPAHQALVRDLLEPISDHRTRIQIPDTL